MSNKKGEKKVKTEKNNKKVKTTKTKKTVKKVETEKIKFCTNCGKELKSGKICSCQEEIEKMNNVDLVSKFVNVLKGMFIKPTDTIKNYTRGENFNFAMILIGILSVMTGLFSFVLIKNGAEILLGGMSSYMISSVDINYFGVFLGSSVMTFALAFGYVGLLYLVNTIMFKGEADYKTIYSMYGIVSIVTTVALAASVILSFISLSLGLLIFVLGSLLNLVYMIKGLKLIGPKDENKHGYIYLITTIFYAIALFIIMQMFM